MGCPGHGPSRQRLLQHSTCLRALPVRFCPPEQLPCHLDVLKLATSITAPTFTSEPPPSPSQHHVVVPKSLTSRMNPSRATSDLRHWATSPLSSSPLATRARRGAISKPLRLSPSKIWSWSWASIPRQLVKGRPRLHRQCDCAVFDGLLWRRGGGGSGAVAGVRRKGLQHMPPQP